MRYQYDDMMRDEMMCTVTTLEPAKVDVRFQLVVEVHEVVHQRVQVVQVDPVDWAWALADLELGATKPRVKWYSKTG